jgi:hypothetical protein
MSIILKMRRQFHKSFVELMLFHPIYRRSALLSLILVLLTFLLPLWRIAPMVGKQDFIPLHYNIYFGIDRFGPWYYVFVPAALGFTLLVINIIFQAAFFRRESVLSYFFAIATVVVEVVLLVAMIFIVLLNL